MLVEDLARIMNGLVEQGRGKMTACIAGPTRDWLRHRYERDEIMAVSIEAGHYIKYDPVNLAPMDISPNEQYVLIGDPPADEGRGRLQTRITPSPIPPDYFDGAAS